APAGSANVSESDNSSGSGFSAGLTRSAGAGPGSMGRTIGDAGSGGEPTLEALSSSVLGSSSPRDDLSQPGGTGGFSSTGPRIIEFPSQSRGNGGSAELGA